MHAVPNCAQNALLDFEDNFEGMFFFKNNSDDSGNSGGGIGDRGDSGDMAVHVAIVTVLTIAAVVTALSTQTGFNTRLY